MSFRPETELLKSTARFLPIPFTLENYSYMLSRSLVPRWFMNSVVVASSRTALTLMVTALAGYAIARIPFRGRRLVFPVILAGLMVPGEAIFVPLYLMVSRAHLNNTYAALILPGAATPFGVFLLTQFFKAIPKDVEEAAMLDGAGRLTCLLRIILPLSWPALITLGIFTFLETWNDYLWPLIVINTQEMSTITIGLPLITNISQYHVSIGNTMAAAWMAILPVAVVFFLFQKNLIRGISLGGTL
jgi:multiple sugar transport system permease protein